jgi:midasin
MLAFVIPQKTSKQQHRGREELALLNMQESRMEETALVQAPLEALSSRLDELLEEWPDHPLLGQLRAICGRVIALPLDSPLKAVLTGLELLLQQAQVPPPLLH